MPWIESHTELSKHPKVLNLAAMMNWPVREAVGALHIFWHWCVDYAEDGDLQRYNDAVIASVVALNPDDGRRFVEALVQCGGEVASGFIEREPYFRVHDWWNYIGPYLRAKYKHNPAKWRKVQKSYLNGSKHRHLTAKTVGKGRSQVPKSSEGEGGETVWPSPEKLVELYNRLTPDECPAVTTLSPGRRQKAKQYLATFPKQQFWEQVFERTHHSKYLRGMVKGYERFRFDFDWMLTKGKDGSENCLKVQEGRYADER